MSAPLHRRFQFLEPDADLHLLYNCLWPEHGPVPDLASEPATLVNLIQIVMDVDNLGSHHPEPSVRYIDLDAHPELAPNKLETERVRHKGKASLVLRHEYLEFWKHALSVIEGGSPPSFFLTGHPGIGKSFGCYYFLFRLLASGQSVFFVTSKQTAYFFSKEGIQQTDQADHLTETWVLVDLDDHQDQPPLIFASAKCVIWTCSPDDRRCRHFVNTFRAQAWCMKAWSSMEIAAATQLLGLREKDVLDTFRRVGPVARTLFAGIDPPTNSQCAQAVQTVLQGNIFTFSPMDPASTGSDRVFLIQPRLETNEQGETWLQRRDYQTAVLSSYMVDVILTMAQAKLESFQGQLSAALDVPATRAMAGKLFEGLMHRYLQRQGVLPAIFGGSTVEQFVTLLGRAESLTCATRPTDSPYILHRRLLGRTRPKPPPRSAQNPKTPAAVGLGGA
ncbi:hypothetical protein K438DRAFT_1835496, partial [Mycena galopus ATCC 62051]